MSDSKVFTSDLINARNQALSPKYPAKVRVGLKTPYNNASQRKRIGYCLGCGKPTRSGNHSGCWEKARNQGVT